MTQEGEWKKNGIPLLIGFRTGHPRVYMLVVEKMKTRVDSSFDSGICEVEIVRWWVTWLRV